MKRRHRIYLSGVVAIGLAACGLDFTGTNGTSAPGNDASTSSDATLPPPSTQLDSTPPDTGSCGNTLEDPENCGECGHSCFTGTCASGTCLPETLAEGFDGPIGVAVSAERVYVAENAGGRIFRIGDAGNELIYNTNKAPTTLVLNNQRLYWGEQALLRTIFVDGGGEKNAPANQVYGLVIDGNEVYYTEFGNGTVLRLNLQLVPGTLPTTVISMGQPSPLGVAVNDTDVYWAVSAGGDSAGIGHSTRDGQAPNMVLVKKENHPQTIRQHDTRVFWTTDGEIRYFDNDGGTEAGTLYMPESAPRALAKSGGRLYWLSAGTGDLRRGEMDGTRAITLATGEPYTVQLPITNGIDFDDKYVYWVTSNGKLKRVAK